MSTDATPASLEPPSVRAPFPARFGPVFTWGLTRVVRWRKVLIVALASVGLGLLIGFEGVTARNPIQSLVRVLDEGVFTFALPLIALLLASEGFSFEVQERTLVYHLVRPVSRTTFYIARFFSGLLPAALVALLFLSAVIGSAGIGATGEIWLSLPVTAGLGILALAAIYYTLAALLKNGLIAGLVYTFVVEGMITSVPGSMQKFSVMFHVRSLHHRLTDEAMVALAEKSGEGGITAGTDGEPGDILLGGAAQIEYDTIAEATVILVGIAVIAMVYGAWKIRRRDFALKD
ncbi:MAG: ABC transporter permease [Planctomycetota bacterium]|jgi:hypothetical protein